MADARLELLADSSQIRTATSDLDKLSAAGSRTEKSAKAMKNELDATAKAQAGFSRKVSQSSIQLEQFFGQVSGGGNIIQAASYQLADLGIVLGNALPFALGAITLSLGNLIFSSEDSADSLEKLDDIAETVGNTLEQAANGSDIFSESIQRLANRSEALARVQIAQTISELEGQISTSAQGIRGAIDEFAAIGLRDFNKIALESGLTMDELAQKAEELSGIVVSNLNGNGLVKFADAVDFVSRKFDLTTEQAVGLASAISEFQNDPSAVGIARLRSEIEDLEGALGGGNQKFNQFAAAALPFFESTRTGVDRINLLRRALVDLDGTLEENSGDTDKAAESAAKLTTNLQAQIIALESGAQAAEIYALTQRAVADGTEDQLPALVALINKKYALKAAQEATEKATKDEAEAWKQIEANYSEFLRTLDKGEAASARRSEQDANRFASLQQQIVLQQQQIALDNDQYELQRNLLALGADDGSDLYKQRAEQITLLTEQMQAMRFEAELIGATLQQSFGDIGISALDSVAQGLADVITQGESAREVFHSIANTILNEMLTAIIRYAIGAATQSVLSTATTTAASVASGAAVAAAWTPAAIAASIATAGASATTGVAAITAGAPVAAGAIAASGLAGFESGGYTGNYGTSEVAGVVHGKEFVVNAQNTAKNRSTLEAMNRGESVGSNVSVVVNNNSTNTTATTEESTDSQGNRVIEIVVADLQSRGQIHRAVTSTTTASGRL